MRFALIFPPQWDPRQPPLCLAALAGALAGTAHSVRAWDLNLELYRSVLLDSFDESTQKVALTSAQKRLARSYSNPAIPRESTTYASATKLIEDVLIASYDPSGNRALLWNGLLGPDSPDSSIDWKRALRYPETFPWFQHISKHLTAIARWNPDVLGISVNSDTQLLSALGIASILRRQLPRSRIVFGGQALRARRHLLKDLDWLFAVADGVCISHGEPTMLALAQDRTYADVPNMFWHDGRAVRGPTILEPAAFSSGLRPDFGVLQFERYLSPVPVVPIETARGCVWGKCSFCGHPNTELHHNHRYCVRRIDSVVREVHMLSQQGHRHFFFVDEALPRDRLELLSSRLLQIPYEPRWICYLRVEEGLNRETLALAQKAGCRKVFVGLETGSRRLRGSHRKGGNIETAINMLRAVGECGLSLHLFLMTGFPGENHRDLRETEMLLSEVLPTADPFGFSYDLFPLHVESGTPLGATPGRFGAERIIRVPERDLAYRFELQRKEHNQQPSLKAIRKRIDAIVERCLGRAPGIRHFGLSNDADHLLLLAMRDAPVWHPNFDLPERVARTVTN